MKVIVKIDFKGIFIAIPLMLPATIGVAFAHGFYDRIITQLNVFYYSFYAWGLCIIGYACACLSLKILCKQAFLADYLFDC